MTCASSGGSERRAMSLGAEIGKQGSLKNFCESLWVRLPSEIPPARSSRELVCRAKRFGKSERRLTAGQTALICYRGGKPDTEVLKTFAGDCVPVGIGSVAPPRKG